MINFENYYILTEWRSELMPKLFTALEKFDDPLVSVHFTKGINGAINLSLNPKPFHNDPIGIYSFPKKYVLEGNLKRNTMFSKMPFIYILKPSSNAKILNLSTLTFDQARDILIKMGIDSPNKESILNDKEIYHNTGNKESWKAGHLFWGVLERFLNKNNKNIKKNITWNVLFKKAGYNVLLDQGDGIIHSNEPSQIVYLERSAVDVLELISQHNTYFKNLLYYFIKQFPTLKVKSIKDYNSFKKDQKRLYSPKGFYLEIEIYDENDPKIKVKIQKEYERIFEEIYNFYDNKSLDDFINVIKQKVSELENTPEINNRTIIPEIFKKISKRYKLKIKKVKSKNDPSDIDYTIHKTYINQYKRKIEFIINYYKNKLYFIIQNNMPYSGFNVNADIIYDIDDPVEYTVKKGLNLLENNVKTHLEPYLKDTALSTIKFLKKRVFYMNDSDNTND